MGSFMRVANVKARQSDQCNEMCDRQRMSYPVVEFDEETSPRLIPNLPDELSLRIIARLPRICYFNARLVSRKWKAIIMSSELYKVRKQLGTTEEWLYFLIKDVAEDKLVWYALEPRSHIWQRLPAMPYPNANVVDGHEKAFAQGFLAHKDAYEFDDEMPLRGCAIGVVDRCLYLLGGLSNNDSPISSVWRFDPIQNMWSKVTSMSTARAYCRVGTLNNKLYVVGGISRDQGPLQCAEVFDPSTDTWINVPSVSFLTASVLLGLEPITTGLTTYMGRLCVAPCWFLRRLVADIGGKIYDPETNSCIEMPIGMYQGWPGRYAVRQTGVVLDGLLYAFDFSNSMDSGFIKVYDQGEDAWKVLTGSNVPLYGYHLHDPYLLAAFHGKLHLITKDVNHDIAILQLNNLDSSVPSTSRSLHEFPESDHALVWKVVSSRGFGQAQLLSCHVIDI